MSASVLLVVVGAFPAAAGTHSPTGSLEQQGLVAFEWYRLSQVNANVSDERLWSLRRDGFTAVYADIGEWLEAAAPPESWGQRRRLRRLAGDRLQGVQFDIEPYVDPSFWDNVTRSLQAYLLTVEGIVGAYEEVRAWPGNEGLGLGFAIPFWFDGVPEAPEVEFGRTEDTITTQLLGSAGPPSGRRPRSSPRPTAGFRSSAASRSTTWTPTRRSGRTRGAGSGSGAGRGRLGLVGQGRRLGGAQVLEAPQYW